jgi:hypothetical protein
MDSIPLRLQAEKRARKAAKLLKRAAEQPDLTPDHALAMAQVQATLAVYMLLEEQAATMHASAKQEG